jgi:hypothetical protein
MAIVIGIVGQTGQGKSTSIVINPDGKCSYLPPGHANHADVYDGLDPGTTVIINADKKTLPFPGSDKWVTGRNVFYRDDFTGIMEILKRVSQSKKIREVVIDTINNVMISKEMRDMKTPGYDKWKDLAMEIVEIINYCNESLPPNIIVYLMCHATLYTDIDGNESKCILSNGRILPLSA